jgi:3-oxoacyl-(acyl-carrier-protein) synthase III
VSGIGIRAVGAHVPSQIITNDDIESWTRMPAEHIAERTGITQRRYAHPKMPTSSLAYWAVVDLLNRYPQATQDLGAIILATSTPDQPQPPTAARLHGLMKAGPIPAWDINAVCTGGVLGLVTGAVHAAAAKAPVLVVAADRYSAIMDPTDWRTVSLFGDGAGAVVLGEVPDGYGVLAHRLMTDGRDESRDLVQVPGGGTASPLTPDGVFAGEDRFRMRGREVKEWVFEHLPPLVNGMLADAGVDPQEVKRWIFHQANPVMLHQLADHMGIDWRRVPVTAPMLGNTGAASVLVTLAETQRRARLQADDLVVLAAVGGGMSAGAVLLRWW